MPGRYDHKAIESSTCSPAEKTKAMRPPADSYTEKIAGCNPPAGAASGELPRYDLAGRDVAAFVGPSPRVPSRQ